jgi:hypothetical protein
VARTTTMTAAQPGAPPLPSLVLLSVDTAAAILTGLEQAERVRAAINQGPPIGFTIELEPMPAGGQLARCACGFGFDAEHVDRDTGAHSCPACFESSVWLALEQP